MSEISQNLETKPKRRPDYFGLITFKDGSQAQCALWKNLKKEGE